MISKTRLLAILCGALLPVFILPAVAHDDMDEYVSLEDHPELGERNLKYFKYGYYVNKQANPNYDLVLDAMQPSFKGTYADKKNKDDFFNPMLSMTEFDLNNDKVSEIIAFPIEADEYGDVLCGPKSLCPHYILDLSGSSVRVAGVIPAYTVDRGDEIKNGYWTLKAFTKQEDPDPANFSYYELYTYDKKEKKYVRQEPVEPPSDRAK